MLLLSLHITLGVATLLFSTIAFFIKTNKNYAIVLNVAGFLSIFTGSLLAVFSGTGGVVYCAKILPYLLFWTLANIYIQKSLRLKIFSLQTASYLLFLLTLLKLGY